MGNFVECFSKIKQYYMYLCFLVHGSCPVMDCLNKLRFTRQSRLEPMVELEDDVVFVQVFPNVV